MRKLISILLMSLLSVSLAVAAAFRLDVAVTPSGAGSLYISPNDTGGMYESGTSIYLGYYYNSGFVFEGWYEGDNLVSSERWFYYQMPAHDTHLEARFLYDPEAPADPTVEAPRYNLEVVSRPAGGGTFNRDRYSMAADETTSLYAYANAGFRFVRWEDEAGQQLSADYWYSYTMPAADVRIYGVFEYDPELPGNPAANHWDPETGEVVLDDFRPGRLTDALWNVVSDRDQVSTIIVQGRMESSDFGIANYCPNVSLVDLSRVTGITQVPSWGFDYSNAQSMLLPADIEEIEPYAFYYCEKLTSLTVFAMTPPQVGYGAFTGVPEGLVVYVPAASVSQYQEAEAWSDFTILPIQQDIRNLTVALPADVQPADYAQMWLELTNTKNGQKMHYVMTDRPAYTFASVIRNTTWNVTLRNERGDVFGQIDGVEVKDDDVTVTFASVAPVCSLTAVVTDANGKDIADRAAVTWTTPQGEYLGQSKRLSGLLQGTEVRLDVRLPEAYQALYVQPAGQTVVAQGAQNVSIALQLLSEVTVGGVVTDAQTGQPLAHAVVTATQTFGVNSSNSLNAQTQADGRFTLTLKNVPTTLSVNLSNYEQQTFVMEQLDDLSALSTIALRPLTGTMVRTTYTIRSSYKADQQQEAQSSSLDNTQADFSIYNITRGKEVEQFVAQAQQLVVLEETSVGDQLSITIQSRNNQFAAASTVAEVKANGTATAAFELLQTGGVEATYEQNIPYELLAVLFDNQGQKVTQQPYANHTAAFSSLTAGTYTLVSMLNSAYLASISNLSELEDLGLQPATDYATNQVQVSDGLITEVYNDGIPVLDESRFYYTGPSTYFSANKAELTAGGYLTLKAYIDFANQYSGHVSDVKLLVNLTDALSLVSNSVIVGNDLCGYSLNGNQVEIPLTEGGGSVKFCVIPTESRDYNVTAILEFVLDGQQTVRQPVGPATFRVGALSLTAPDETSVATITVSGVALPRAQVEIFDGETLIGIATSLQSGDWSQTVTLNLPFNYTYHAIHARVTDQQGLVYNTESHVVYYEEGLPQITSVQMINNNFDLLVDLLNPTAAVPYSFNPSYQKFTFVARSNVEHSNEQLDGVDVVVYTSDGDATALPATYDKQRDVWVATGNFTSNALPTAVDAELIRPYRSYRKVSEGHMDYLSGLFRDLDMDRMLVEGTQSGEQDYRVNIVKLAEQPYDNGMYMMEQRYDFESLVPGLESFSFNLREELRPITAEELELAIPECLEMRTESKTFYLNNDITDDHMTFLFYDPQAMTLVVRSFYYAAGGFAPPRFGRESWVGTVASCIGIGAAVVGLVVAGPVAGAVLTGIGIATGIIGLADTGYDHYKAHKAIEDHRDCLINSGMYDKLKADLSRAAKFNYGVGAVGLFLGGASAAAKTGSLLEAGLDGASTGASLGGLMFGPSMGDIQNAADNCREPEPEDPDDPDDPDDPHHPHYPSDPHKPRRPRHPHPHFKPSVDPSGYVYEAVSSNRLEGVTATAFYKEEVEDMYGDLHEEIVKWDAEEYAQKNPLFTDEFGMYAWDVPQGMWQVKFEKAGYETTYSEWLPVPPPQLEVNVAMTTRVQPTVRMAHAYETAVEVEFDKYMDPATLTAENLYVLVNGEAVSGAVVLLDEEVSYAGQAEAYASRVRLEYAQPFEATEVTLVVSRRAESYAGVRMEADFMQAFTVEREVQQIVCQETAYVDYGGTTTLQLDVLPAEAAAGKVLHVATSSAMIVDVTTPDVTIDAEGHAFVTLSGELPGTAGLTFTLEGSKRRASTIVNVISEDYKLVEAPRATIASGSTVTRGTTVALTTTNAQAVIYYTTDGTSPYDELTRQRYTSPIVIDRPMTIRAIAEVPGGFASQLVELTYFVEGQGIEVVAQDQPVQVTYYDMQGHRVATPRPGTFVIARMLMPDGKVRSSKVRVR